MIKKIAIGFIVLLILLAAGANYLWSNLDSIVKSAVEKYGTQAAQTDVRLSSVKLLLTSGEGMLNGLSIANPKGFSSAKAFEMGAISVSIDTGSLTGNGPIIIKEITIEKPQVAYEVNPDGSSNLQTIERNATNYAASAASSAPADNGGAKSSSAEGRKIIIKDLYIREGQIHISSSLLQGQGLAAPLPTIHLTNIGKGGGATPAEVAGQVLDAISASAAKVASTDLAKQIPGLKNLPSGAGDIGNSLKGIIGR